jgi:hypothetical protein
MKSEFFSMFGIPPTGFEIEARKDELATVVSINGKSAGRLGFDWCYPASAFVD